MRPCPLSTVRAVLASGSDDSIGGKSLDRVEEFGDPIFHRRLIVFHMQNVIRPFVCKGFRNLRLTEHRIADDDLARDWYDPQEPQRGLVFVGFRIDANRADHGLDLRREHRDPMHGRCVAIVRAAERFAIQGEVLAEIGTALQDPIAEDRFEGVESSRRKTRE
jgi:hypothetical protein